jgi:hypothetical protein
LDIVAGAHTLGSRFDGDGHENSGAFIRASFTRDAYANVSICRQDSSCRSAGQQLHLRAQVSPLFIPDDGSVGGNCVAEHALFHLQMDG